MVIPKDFIHGQYSGLSCICRFDLKCCLLFNYIALPKNYETAGDSKKLRLSDESIITILFIFQILLLLPPSAARENLLPILHRVQDTYEWPEREVAIKVSTRFFYMRVPNRFLGTQVFSYLKLGIRDLKSKIVRDSRLKVCARVRMPEITLGVTRLHEILGRSYGIEEPYSGPSIYL